MRVILPVSIGLESAGFQVQPVQTAQMRSYPQHIISTVVADGSDITAEDMKKLTYLTIGSTSGVEDIAGIQYAVNLQTLDIDGDVSGLHQLQSLSGLVRLTINSNNFVSSFQSGLD